MRHLRLHPHVSYGLVAGRPVFLDVSRDRYLALDPVAEYFIYALIFKHRAKLSVKYTAARRSFRR